MIGNCRLCDKAGKLCRSHILPKSFTRRMRAGSPQVAAVYMRKEPNAVKSNGEHAEYLLCSACEHLLKIKYEDYGTRIFVEKNSIEDGGKNVLIRGFRYNTFYLFVVSIMWRASVSSLEIYKSSQPLSEFGRLFKPCILNETLNVSSLPGVVLNKFLKISVQRIFDHTSQIPQHSLDSIIYGANVSRGEVVEDGVHFFFMVDGYLVCASLFPLNSPHADNWLVGGRVINRSTLKIPKVSFYEIKEIYEGISAIATTTNPFLKR